MSPDDPTAPERLVLASVIANEVAAERDLPRRRKLEALLLRVQAGHLSGADRPALGYAAKREIESNRYPLAIPLELLNSALAKLCPADERAQAAADNRAQAGPPLVV